MQVSQAMRSGFVGISPFASLAVAASTMRALGTTSLLVCEDRRLVGVLTERTLRARRPDGLDPWSTPVRELMTSEIPCCRYSDDVRRTARRMRENHLRRLLVLDEEGHLLGRVSLTDLARAVGRRAVMASRLRRLRARGVPSARRRSHGSKSRARSMQALALGA